MANIQIHKYRRSTTTTTTSEILRYRNIYVSEKYKKKNDLYDVWVFSMLLKYLN